MTFFSQSTRADLSRFFQRQPNIFLARYLPLSLYRKYLFIIGFYYYGINTDERKSISQSLNHVLDEKLSAFKFFYLKVKTYLGIFDHYCEKMINAHKSLVGMMNYLNRSVSVSGARMLRQASERGCILVTGHFGGVEYIPLFLAANNYRPSIILRFKTNTLKQALVKKSNAVDLELIDADSPNVVFKALNAINKGRILITLCDEIRDWRPSKKERISLFGQALPKDRTLDILYRRAKAPVYFGLIHRSKNHYDLSVQPLADGVEDISLSEASWKRMEYYIRQYPYQWYQWPNFYTEVKKYSMELAWNEA
ncbi:lipid A biosynthesis acyltransferase [Desulfosarcina variabilis str. Montpellier]